MNPSSTPEQQPQGQVPEIPEAPTPTTPTTPAPNSVTPLPQIPLDQAIPQPVVPAMPADNSTGESPAIADDVDVIEKEWVDKAEAIVKETAGDPHAEEEAIEKLQIDYLKKRYDHTVGKPDDEG